VFVSGNLIGELVRPADTGPGALGPELYVYFVAPTLDTFLLPSCTGLTEALALLLTAAKDYRYQPHPVGLTHRHVPAAGKVMYVGICPTCVRAGGPDMWTYDTLADAQSMLLADHHNTTGHHAQFDATPQPLPRVTPPVVALHRATPKTRRDAS
jgi:hypothetical protein